ncbi:hypothetical protein JB92DRAFT_3118805 [Gautieria morchelliformis]|nr:hypothetical protein JB92DRAFT_3118805 [Gautieria morchelliformis]
MSVWPPHPLLTLPPLPSLPSPPFPSLPSLPFPPLPSLPSPPHTGFKHLGDPNDAGARCIMWQVDGKPSYAATEIAQRLIFDVDYSELGHVA